MPKTAIRLDEQGICGRRTLWIGQAGFAVRWNAKADVWTAYRYVRTRPDGVRLIKALGCGLSEHAAVQVVERNAK